MERVAIKHCNSYEEHRVQQAVDEAILALGGWEKYIRPGMQVALKVNLLKRNRPEDHVTTHPAVVKAVAKRVVERGAQAIIGDSPGGPYNKSMLEGIYRHSGMADVARETGAILNQDFSTVECANLEGEALKQLSQTSFISKADVVINLPKLKTHGMMQYTGAVKNLFGTIPGTAKVEYHYRMPDIPSFANMLIDICQYVKPALTIMDAIWGMEGDGPSAGTPREIGAVLAGENPYYLDFVAAGIITGLPLEFATVYFAGERGLGPKSMEEVSLVGDDYHSLFLPDFMVPEGGGTAQLRGILGHLGPLGKWLRPKPVFSADVCIACGICAKSCPADAIHMEDAPPPDVDLGACIRCFCCHELCPVKAVSIKRNPILRWLR
ncbi:DUF362 domain-containing protein [Eubacteriales bacterium OttesenSCG-928-M02]|nr:DUF362 domain-containing protein [Eubacteriales bacterium OttesenSCG-928-M02]